MPDETDETVIPNTGQQVAPPVGQPWIGMTDDMTGYPPGDPGDMCFEMTDGEWYYADQTGAWRPLGGGGTAPVPFAFTLDINGGQDWTSLVSDVFSFAVNDRYCTNIATVPLTLPAGGFFRAGCRIDSPGATYPAGTIGNVNSSVLTVSNVAATQVFSTFQSGASQVTSNADFWIPWGAATWLNVGSDLHLDATNTMIQTTAGGVFMATLYGNLWREA